jgi:hypothetical protein
LIHRTYRHKSDGLLVEFYAHSFMSNPWCRPPDPDAPVLTPGPYQAAGDPVNPTARRTNVIVQELGAETLVYDRVRNVMHSLNPVAAGVFAHADGSRSVDDLVIQLQSLGVGADVDDVEAGLGELERVHLLDVARHGAECAATGARGATFREQRYPLRPSNLTRRDAARRIGAVALAAPMIASILAPTPAMAASAPSSLSPISLVGDKKDKKDK